MDIPRLPPTASLDEVMQHIDLAGAVIIDRLFAGSVLDALSRDLAPYLRSKPAGSQTGNESEQSFHGPRTTRFGGLAGKSAAFVDVLLNPLVLGAAEQLLLPACGAIQCAGTQVMAIGPGEPAQYLHRDEGAWKTLVEADFAPELAMSAMVAITDFTAENGATRVSPGTHKMARTDLAAFDEGLVKQAEMEAGSVLLYTSKVVHSGGANQTNATRVGMHIFFALGWLRSEEAHQIALSKEDAIRLPDADGRLLGFGAYDGDRYGGGRLWTVDYDDPAALYRV
jgi:ectoine hydroxylase-related dioxygenase (phytanoyl-CoA dioxygenase family)